jgi:hypothetical protein
MEKREEVMAAITAAIGQYEEEEALAAATIARPLVTSYWKYWGIGEMMRMRMLWQRRMCPPRPFQRR